MAWPIIDDIKDRYGDLTVGDLAATDELLQPFIDEAIADVKGSYTQRYGATAAAIGTEKQKKIAKQIIAYNLSARVPGMPAGNYDLQFKDAKISLTEIQNGTSADVELEAYDKRQIRSGLIYDPLYRESKATLDKMQEDAT